MTVGNVAEFPKNTDFQPRIIHEKDISKGAFSRHGEPAILGVPQCPMNAPSNSHAPIPGENAQTPLKEASQLAPRKY